MVHKSWVTMYNFSKKLEVNLLELTLKVQITSGLSNNRLSYINHLSKMGDEIAP